ncbi:CHAT domain-containing protein [Neosynechococcus sphagnicola]|uniref:CHAT domain-containing protein n=1 Tax=Neosynechococcus sphagnicola TaxID=1501145 RepID=UPI0009DF5E99|nr:CHAT domain-containing protein [Neosynechococcus sphagnicola]
MDTVKILFLAADPSDSVRLRLGQELRDIREKLQLSRYRDNFHLESRESVRTGDISQAIFDTEPQIVHFSGHGTGTGELCFEDVQGKTKPVKPDALANLFKLVANQVNCVILNACYSEAQAKSIAKHIPFVIGMNDAIGDKAAIAFAVGFYRALGSGRSVKEAYDFACVEIQLESIPEYLTPVLLERESIIRESEEEANEIDTPISSTSVFFAKIFKILPWC